MVASAVFVALALAAGSAMAAPSPLTPGTSNEGAMCTASWTPDATGTWTDTNIELMSGDNQQMVHLTTIATGVDTTSATNSSFTYPCPAVEPNSAIYFLQFSHESEPNALQWTTRFAIAGPNGELVDPEHATQPDGSAIPWGVGELEDPSTAVPAPSYIKGQSSSGGATDATGSGSSSVASASRTASTSAGTSSHASSTAKSSASATTSAAANQASGNGADSMVSRSSSVLTFGGFVLSMILMF